LVVRARISKNQEIPERIRMLIFQVSQTDVAAGAAFVQTVSNIRSGRFRGGFAHPTAVTDGALDPVILQTSGNAALNDGDIITAVRIRTVNRDSSNNTITINVTLFMGYDT